MSDTPDHDVPTEAIEGSSNIARAGYDPERQIFAVVFKGGHTYQYAPVSLETATAFYTAASRGKFYTEQIKDKVPGVKLSGLCPKCEGIGRHGERCDLCGCATFDREAKTSRQRAREAGVRGRKGQA